MDWKQEARRLRFKENKSIGDITRALMGCFPNKTELQAYDKIKSYLRRQPEHKQRNQASDEPMSSFEMKPDGTGISDKLIEICDNEEMTPEFLMKAHGLDSTKWEVMSYKNNYWHSQIKGGKRLVMYQSKVTVKPKENKFDFENIDKHFEKLERRYKPLAMLPPSQKGNLMAEVNIADLHFGRLCWQGDTGNNYDYKIARGVFQQIISDVHAELKDKDIEYILLPIGNDLINSDTPGKETTAGTPQDTDARWQKLIDMAEEMLISAVDTLKTIAPVKAMYIKSNHDEVTTYGIVKTVGAWFRNDPRVTVDTSPLARKYHLYGANLIGFSHGNSERPQKGTKDNPCKLASLMPVEAKQMWAEATYYEFHAAHLHSEHATEEVNGVIVRRISSPTAQDTWTYTSGYVGAVRKAQTFIYDKEIGLTQIINTPVR